MVKTRPALLLSLLTLATTATAFSPYERGPHNTTHIHISTADNPELVEEVEVWVPVNVGLYNVFYFLSGITETTQLPAYAYSELFDHIASHGIAVVAPWSLILPDNPVDKVSYLESVMEWTYHNLNRQLHHNGLGLGVLLFLEHYLMGAHSAAAYVQVEYLKKTCYRVMGQVLVSPVDGMDSFCINPGTFLNYGNPTLVLGTGYDAVPGESGVACAPDELSNDRFYNAVDPEMTSKWSIKAPRFGHADLMDQYYINLVEETGYCGYNSELTHEEHDVYRRFVGGQIVAFYKGLYSVSEHKCNSYLSYVQDPSLMSVQVEVKHSNHTGMCPRGSCSWISP
ncbi:chlorophyllase-1, chloroplastic-like [Portunus trituberculatus]|uniref:chlorophyllase-1, chloroplastic-like n=1 Tax=Portunus trituberculatus TaxID=210409 RepID=UPI001E1CC49D|nr:chlorophyllase-1, chloroplastic-like [Portunus trituberculatus]